jgi:hypothetical protein
MRRIQLLLQCLLMAFATQAMSAQTGKDCETKAQQIATEKRDAFLRSCLAQTSAPANVQEVTLQNKRRTCEQNAKNLKLNPGNKPGYVEECIHKNEAAMAAKNLHAPHAGGPTVYAENTAKNPVSRNTKVSPAKTTKRSGKPKKKA